MSDSPMLIISPDVLRKGAIVSVGVRGYRPGRRVPVKVSTDLHDHVAAELQIDMRGDGGVTAMPWIVPDDWSVAFFTAPGCEQVTRVIEENPVLE